MRAYIGNIQITEDDLDTLERLLEVDGQNGSLYIYDEAMRKALTSQGYVKANNLGWVWGTMRLRTLLPKIKKSLEKKQQLETLAPEGWGE